MGINDFGGANDPLANPPLGGPSGWAASVRDALTALQGQHVIRSTRPNTTDHLVEVFDGSAWFPIHYDSGWRDVTGLLNPGWTATHVHMRREGDTVRMRVAGLAAPGEEFYFISPPEGFRTAMQYYLMFGSLTYQVAQEAGAIAIMAPGGGKLPAGGTFWFEMGWATPDPFPQSLPGTVIAPAPAPPPDVP